MLRTTRRQFLTKIATAAAGPMLLARTASAIDPIGRTRPSHLKLSLAAFSYRDFLVGPKKTMDLFGFVDLAADLGLDAVELTSYYFPEDVSPEYLNRLKTHAFRQGLDVSGTAVMNDFCLPPGPEADKEVEHVRTWIGRAAELDAPMIRVLSGNWLQGTPELELERRVMQRIESLLPEAAQKGVMLALENHGGGVTVTAEQASCGWVPRQSRAPNFGVNLLTQGTSTAPTPTTRSLRRRAVRGQRPGSRPRSAAEGQSKGAVPRLVEGHRHPPRREILQLRRAGVQRPPGPEDRGSPVLEDAPVPDQP